jgi:hypothetical protein
MKDLYEQIQETVKQLKLKPCKDTYGELEKLLNRSIPSDGSEDVVKYYTIKMLLKSKALIPGNIASNESIRYMALWMTPEMIVRHFDLQNHIELTFTQSNRFVQGDYIRGDYTVREKRESSTSQTSQTSQISSPSQERNRSSSSTDFTVVSSRKSRDSKDSDGQQQKKNTRYNSTSSYVTRSVKYKNKPDSRTNQSRNKSDVRETREIRDKRDTSNSTNSTNSETSNIRATKSDSLMPISKSSDDIKPSSETEVPKKLSSSINWGSISITNWADEEDSD